MNGLEGYIPFVARGKSLEITKDWMQKNMELFAFIQKKMAELGASDVVLDRFQCRIMGFVFTRGVKVPHGLTKSKGHEFYVPRTSTAPGLRLFKEIRDAAIPTYASLLDPTYPASNDAQPGFKFIGEVCYIFVPRKQDAILESAFYPEESSMSTLSEYYVDWERNLITQYKEEVSEGKED